MDTRSRTLSFTDADTVPGGGTKTVTVNLRPGDKLTKLTRAFSKEYGLVTVMRNGKKITDMEFTAACLDALSRTDARLTFVPMRHVLKYKMNFKGQQYYDDLRVLSRPLTGADIWDAIREQGRVTQINSIDALGDLIMDDDSSILTEDQLNNLEATASSSAVLKEERPLPSAAAARLPTSSSSAAAARPPPSTTCAHLLDSLPAPGVPARSLPPSDEFGKYCASDEGLTVQESALFPYMRPIQSRFRNDPFRINPGETVEKDTFGNVYLVGDGLTNKERHNESKSFHDDDGDGIVDLVNTFAAFGGSVYFAPTINTKLDTPNPFPYESEPDNILETEGLKIRRPFNISITDKDVLFPICHQGANRSQVMYAVLNLLRKVYFTNTCVLAAHGAITGYDPYKVHTVEEIRDNDYLFINETIIARKDLILTIPITEGQTPDEVFVDAIGQDKPLRFGHLDQNSTRNPLNNDVSGSISPEQLSINRTLLHNKMSSLMFTPKNLRTKISDGGKVIYFRFHRAASIILERFLEVKGAEADKIYFKDICLVVLPWADDINKNFSKGDVANHIRKYGGSISQADLARMNAVRRLKLYASFVVPVGIPTRAEYAFIQPRIIPSRITTYRYKPVYWDDGSTTHVDTVEIATTYGMFLDLLRRKHGVLDWFVDRTAIKTNDHRNITALPFGATTTVTMLPSMPPLSVRYANIYDEIKTARDAMHIKWSEARPLLQEGYSKAYRILNDIVETMETLNDSKRAQISTVAYSPTDDTTFLIPTGSYLLELAAAYVTGYDKPLLEYLQHEIRRAYSLPAEPSSEFVPDGSGGAGSYGGARALKQKRRSVHRTNTRRSRSKTPKKSTRRSKSKTPKTHRHKSKNR